MTQVRTILGKVGFSPRGEWNGETAYERLDVVSFIGSSFVSLSDDNKAQLADATRWMPVAKKGDKGDAFTYDDFTPEQLAKLKGEKGDAFIYDDFTPEQIEGLKQPATDAAQVARDAAAEALNVPKIQDGYFWIYDVDQKKYIKTNSPATGKSPKAIDGIWWEYNDEIGDYVSTNISASSDYELTKPKIETVFTGDITSHNHATQLAEALANYVQVVAGKQLSTEDFTTALKNKLIGLENYNDAAVVASIAAVNSRLDTLIGTSASEAIDTFQEIEAFLQGITDTKTLTGLLSDLKAEIVAIIPTKLSQLTNDDNTVKDANYQHTDNNYTNADKTKLAKINFVPTLDHEPGENDLSFSDSDGEHTFLIGNQARVLDAEKGEFVFWQLYDIAGGKAIWKKAGSGGDMQLTEKLIITLSSNQAQPDTKLNGLVVHVRYGDNDTPLTWNGAAMTTEIPMNMTYTIEYPALAGYSVPEVEEYIALAGNTRNIEASYNTTILTINVSGNQTDKSDLDNLQITLSGSYNKILTYVGQPLVVNVPTGQQLVITPAQIEGYATVGAVTKTPTASVDTVSFAYNTTIMSITLTSNQGTDATLNAGTNVVVKCGTINKTLIWKGSTLTQKIPTGQAYTITPAALSGYKTPTAKTGTATGTSMSESMQYQTELVTVTVNTDNSVSCSGQKVTINGTEYTYSNPIAVKIPFGTSYSVSVNGKAGFTSPDAQSFTANQASRSVTMTYLEIKRGIFILDTDGNLVKRADWNTGNNSKAVGVAVLSDNCKFVISTTENSSNIQWGGYGTTISNIVTTTDAATAKKDYLGSGNTDKIIAQLGSGNAPAADYCRGVTFKHGKKGYLGSLGEWQEAYNNKAEIDACMSLIGGTAINTSYYHWTSTQCSSGGSWILGWSDGSVGYGTKNGSGRVRTFAALT
jgi:hypothetical protein